MLDQLEFIKNIIYIDLQPSIVKVKLRSVADKDGDGKIRRYEQYVKERFQTALTVFG